MSPFTSNASKKLRINVCHLKKICNIFYEKRTFHCLCLLKYLGKKVFQLQIDNVTESFTCWVYNCYLAVTDKNVFVEDAINIATGTLLQHKEKVENIRYYIFWNYFSPIIVYYTSMNLAAFVIWSDIMLPKDSKIYQFISWSVVELPDAFPHDPKPNPEPSFLWNQKKMVKKNITGTNPTFFMILPVLNNFFWVNYFAVKNFTQKFASFRHKIKL